MMLSEEDTMTQSRGHYQVRKEYDNAKQRVQPSKFKHGFDTMWKERAKNPKNQINITRRL